MPSALASAPKDPRVKERARQRRERRKARERAGEIKELNITAMMDMMTIILVFLLKSYSASALNVNQTEALKLAQSTTQLAPQDNVNVTISLDEVAVNDKPAVKVENGVIPAGARDGKAQGYLVPSVYQALKREVEKQKYIAKYNPKAPFTGRVNVIADRRIPYRTVMEVLYTAGQAELGEYKFMVMKSE
ncbi:MAG TPA: biopolymer transporter ExbD [Anaeromyxobacteraceae bacterium]|jgi:biopolymer transport protein ExbD|nr:biopolymer transporter ExbD [Anaeromyxobacteraceae bacterium]